MNGYDELSDALTARKDLRKYELTICHGFATLTQPGSEYTTLIRDPDLVNILASLDVRVFAASKDAAMYGTIIGHKEDA